MANGQLVLPSDSEVSMGHRNFQLVIVCCLLLTAAYVAAAQTGGRAPQKTNVPAPQRTAGPDDNWWAAQRNIEAAIAQLEKYLRESPNSKHAPAARQQLAALRSLSVTQSQPELVPMRALALPDVPLWRVSGVEQLSDRTRVMIEVKCGRNDGGDCNLRPFDRFPLVLLDSDGELYPMLETRALPSDLRVARDGQVLFSSGRTVNLMVDFVPLRAAATGGHIQYRDANEAQPARFSLVQKP